MRIPRHHITSFVSGVVGVVVGAVVLGGVSYAANGSPFLLGRANSETATASLTNTRGIPISLVAKSGYAPLKVNTSVKVANLNADKLDGVSAESFLRTTSTAYNSARLGGKAETAFALAAGQFAYVDGADAGAGQMLIDWDFDGTDDSVLSWASCPAGTTVVSGGYDIDPGVEVVSSSPWNDNTWNVVTTGTSSSAWPYAVCYNPRGTVTGGTAVKGAAAAAQSSKVAALAQRAGR